MSLVQEMKATLSALVSFVRRGWSRTPGSSRAPRSDRGGAATDIRPFPLQHQPKRQILSYALEALQAEAHHLTRWPELTFPHLYNELHHKRSKDAVVRTLCESGAARFDRTWLRRTAPDKTRSPNLRATFAGHEDIVHGCRFPPDSRYLASVCLSGTLRVWDVPSGRELACLRSDGASLRDCCWSPDGERIAVVGDTELLRVWDWKNQEIAMTISIADEGIVNCLFLCCDWSPDGKGILSQRGRSQVAFWDAASGAPLWSKPYVGHLDDCEFSTDGSRIGFVAGSTVSVYAVPWSGKRPWKLLFQKRHEVSGGRCCFSRDGRTFAYVSRGYDVGLVDTRKWSERAIEGTLGHDCGLSPDGKSLLIAGGFNEFLWTGVYDARSLDRLGALSGHQDMVLACDWSADGRWIATGSRDGTVKIWDASVPWAEDEERSHGLGVVALAWHPDASTVLSVGRDGRAHLWDADTGSWVATVESRVSADRPELTGCSFAPDGAAFVIADVKGVVEMINADTRCTVWSVQAHERDVQCCVWAPVGDRIASCGADGVKLWDAGTGQFLAVLEETEHSTRRSSSLCFSPDGRRLAFQDASGVSFFDLNESRLVARVGVVWGCGHEMAWSPDGLALLIGDEDQSVVVLDPVPPRAFARLSGHRGVELWSTNYSGRYGVSAEVSCAFINDHRVAVTAYVDGTLKVWDVRAGEQITQAVTDAAFRCLAASGRRICAGDDQGYLHWFSLENIESGLAPDSPPIELIWPEWCARCGDDRTERRIKITLDDGRELLECQRCGFVPGL